MNRQNTIIIFASFVALFMILISPLSSVATIQAQTQAPQSQQGKFFMIFKVRPWQSVGTYRYEVYNMTTNMKKFPSSPNEKIEYSLKDIFVDIYDCSVWWYIPYKVVDSTSTPNIIRTKQATIGSNIMMNCIKEVNTLTKTTTYTGPSAINAWTPTSSPVVLYNNVSVKATLYPNGTGIVESKER